MVFEISTDPERAWQAVLERDRAYDGRFVFAVTSTGVFCRPSCPARRPARDRVRFFGDSTDAAEAGFRPCRRCRPDEVARDEAAIARAAELLAGDPAPAVPAVAAAVGYSQPHLIRLFRTMLGVTPAQYVRALRADRMRAGLGDEPTVTDAIYAAGFGAVSRFYADSDRRLGMTPRQWRDGGKGVAIRWAVVETNLGPLLVATTAKGICRVAFDEGEADLRARFPEAELQPMDSDATSLLDRVVAAVETPRTVSDLPLDLRGTAFQEAVWQALGRIPVGETLSYAALAAAAGHPDAVRAVGSACGANPVAVLIPCHRALRGDGGLGGYAWGLDRKRMLLDREREDGV